jgi:hypothetical protein
VASSSMLRRTRSVPSLRFPRLAWRGAQDRKEKDLASRRLTGPLDLGIGICRAGRATDRGRGHKSAWRKARSGGVGVRGADRPRETRSPAGAAGCGLRARSAHGHRGMPGTGPFCAPSRPARARRLAGLADSQSRAAQRERTRRNPQPRVGSALSSGPGGRPDASEVVGQLRCSTALYLFAGSAGGWDGMGRRGRARGGYESGAVATREPGAGKRYRTEISRCVLFLRTFEEGSTTLFF